MGLNYNLNCVEGEQTMYAVLFAKSIVQRAIY
jgi:hypothetical protein